MRSPENTVAVTGAAGSIGSALVRQLSAAGTGAIRAIDTNETGLHHLGAAQPGVRLIVGDVRDLDRMRLALSGVDVVFHAAALKHVGLGEYNSSDLVATNVTGTSNVATACHEQRVSRLVLISTDKASEPTSAMGASKMLAERVVLDLNLWSACHGNVVRFGNVFGSRGSVVPTLLRQLARENVATITDPECTRFTLPIDRAVQLVMRASDITRGSIAVLRMPAYRLDDLGYAILSVWNEGRPESTKATLKAVGLKPGERKHEALMSASEVQVARAEGDWFVIDRNTGSGLSTKEQPHIQSWSAERMERPKLIKAVREYMAEVQREMWE